MNAVIRHNLLTRPGYTPYCGAVCNSMPRTRFDGEQFRCEDCGWVSSFEPEFIARYKLADAIARKARALGHTAELGEKYATLRNNETGCAIPFASHKEAAVWLLVREGRPHFRGIGESLKLTSVSELAHKLEEQDVLEALTRPPKEQRPRPVAQSAPMDPAFLAELRMYARGGHRIEASEVRELLADRDHWEKQIKELLAVIHGDGRHHSDSVGIAQSLADAHDALPMLRAQLTESNRERDEARRDLCTAASNAFRMISAGSASPAAVARELGWGYLYPEEGDQ